MQQQKTTTEKYDFSLMLIGGILFSPIFVALLLAYIISIPIIRSLINLRIYKINKQASEHLLIFQKLEFIIGIFLFTMLLVFNLWLSIEISNKNGFIDSWYWLILDTTLWLSVLFLFIIIFYYRFAEKRIEEKALEQTHVDLSKGNVLQKDDRILLKILQFVTQEKFIVKQHRRFLIQKKIFISEESGVILNKEVPVVIPKSALNRGVGVFGITGAGKTNTLKHFVKSAITCRQSIIFINGKGDDELALDLKTASENNNYNYYLWDSRSKFHNFNYNIFKNKNSNYISNVVMELGNYSTLDLKSSDAMYYKESELEIINLVSRILVDAEKKIDFVELTRWMDYKKLKTLVNAIPSYDNYDRGRTVNELKSVFEDTKKSSQASSLQTIFKNISAIDPKFEKFGNKGKSLEEILKEQKPFILLFNLDILGSNIAEKKIAKMLLMDIKQNMITIKNQKKPVTLICDEFGSFATNTIAEVLEQQRSFGLNTVLGMQTISNLKQVSKEFSQRILGNINTIIAHRLKENEGAEEIAGLFGTRSAAIKTIQTDDGISSGRGSVREGEEYIFHPRVIKQLPDHFAVVGTIDERKPDYKPDPILIDYIDIGLFKASNSRQQDKETKTWKTPQIKGSMITKTRTPQQTKNTTHPEKWE